MDEIRQLTPLGQMLIGKMRTHKATHRGVCKALRISFNTWERCLTGRLDTISKSTKNKLRRWLGIEHLPEAPEDLSLLHNLVAAHDEDHPWTPPYKILEQIQELRGTTHMKHYLLAYANRLSEYIYGSNDGVMAIEIHARFTRYVSACSVDMDIFALSKPLTKMRLTMELSGSMRVITYRLTEFNQQTNREVMCFEGGSLTKESLRRVMLTLIPAFCFSSRSDPELTALENALRQKEQIKDASNIRSSSITGSGSGEPAASDSVHTEGTGAVPVRGQVRSFRKRGFKRNHGGRKRSGRPSSGLQGGVTASGASGQGSPQKENNQ